MCRCLTIPTNRPHIKAMPEEKKIQVRSGRISRLFKLPVGAHEKIKHLAKQQGVAAYDLYDQIIEDFANCYLTQETKPDYLFHQGEAKNTKVALKEKIVLKVKKLAKRDAVAENRIMFTAVMLFCRTKLDKQPER